MFLARLALAAFLAWSGSAAALQITFPTDAEPIRPVLPKAGAYYSPASSGSGLLLDVGAGGFVFGAFFYHDAGGTRWLTVAGQFTPTDFLTWAETGETGYLETQLLQTAAGPIGFNQTGPAGVSTPQAGPLLQLTWFGPDRVRVTWGNTEQMLGPLLALDPAGPADSRIVGSWRVTSLRTVKYDIFPTSDQQEYATGEMIITAADPVLLFAQGPTPLPLPGDTSKWYHVEMSQELVSSFTVPDATRGTIYFNAAARVHESQQYCFAVPSGCVQGSGATARYRVDPNSTAARYYFVSADRILARVFRYSAPGVLEHVSELVMDRKTPDVEQQGVIPCERAASPDGIQPYWCGYLGRWP